MLCLPYSASNTHLKSKLHLALVNPFPFSSLLHGTPGKVLFIRCHSALSTSICGCKSSARLAVNAEHTEEILYFLLLKNHWDPDDFLHVSGIIHLCRPFLCENSFSEYLFSLCYWFFLSKYIREAHHLTTGSAFETNLTLWPTGERNYWQFFSSPSIIFSLYTVTIICYFTQKVRQDEAFWFTVPDRSKPGCVDLNQ